jgi:hypothetical protein
MKNRCPVELGKLPDYRTDSFVSLSVELQGSSTVLTCSDGEVFGANRVLSYSKLNSTAAVSPSEVIKELLLISQLHP